jgi:hypothetical protein
VFIVCVSFQKPKDRTLAVCGSTASGLIHSHGVAYLPPEMAIVNLPYVSRKPRQMNIRNDNDAARHLHLTLPAKSFYDLADHPHTLL